MTHRREFPRQIGRGNTGTVEKDRQIERIGGAAEILKCRRVPIDAAVSATLEKREPENQQARHHHEDGEPEEARRHEQPCG